jgi:hypothetical protein
VSISTGAALAISIKVDHDRYRILLQTNGAELAIESSLHPVQLQGEREALRRSLESVRNSLSGSATRHLPGVAKALRILHERGRAIVRHLFGPPNIPRVERFCREALGFHQWPPERPGWENDARAPRRVEIRTDPSYGIPFDMLPLLDFSGRPPDVIKDSPTLARAASMFLGFSAIVARTFGDVDSARRRQRIDNDPLLSLRFFRHYDLNSAIAAAEFFRSHSATFEVPGGAWPTTQAPASKPAFVEALVDHLSSVAHAADGARRTPALCYFVCHCDTSARLADDYTIDLTPGRLRERKVTLLELEDVIHTRSQAFKERWKGTWKGPLVFLNACGSGAVDPFTTTSFTQLFTSPDYGFLGFIGTEVTVPDLFAGRFGESLYRHFVGGLPLGEAFYAARWHMLRRHHDPFGLMYTLYADPEIQTRKNVPELRQDHYRDELPQ